MTGVYGSMYFVYFLILFMAGWMTWQSFMGHSAFDPYPFLLLLFIGNLIHGSYPNRSATRFRRSFIGHYVGQSAEQVARFYKPLYRRDGTEVVIPDSPADGGPCGGPEAKGPH